jgi:guanylate kinase
MTPDPQPAALLAVAAPSCAGKDTLLGELLRHRPELMRPLTCTTRPPRPGEQDGVHYHFLTEDAFQSGVEAGAFLEHAHVHGRRYGLRRDEIERVLSAGRSPAVILDVQGVRSVERVLPIASVFIVAPLGDLRRRILQERPGAEIEARMRSIQREMDDAARYDYVIQNPDGGQEDAVAALMDRYDESIRPRLEAYRVSRRPRRTATPAARPHRF